MQTKELVRLQKYLAQRGFGSRRKLEIMIAGGNITVNGVKAHLGIKVTGDEDIRINGKTIEIKDVSPVVYAVNKPAGVVSTVSDEHKRKTVCDLVSSDLRLFPVGRLDIDTSGLILLTNDGDLAQRLTHPKYEVEKEYILTLAEPLSPQQIDQITSGIDDDRDSFHVDKVEITGKTSYNLVLHEGKKREIRRIMAYVGADLISIKRIRIGSLQLGTLKEGEYKELSQSELNLLSR